MATRVTMTPRGRQTEITSSSTRAGWEAGACFSARPMAVGSTCFLRSLRSLRTPRGLFHVTAGGIPAGEETARSLFFVSPGGTMMAVGFDATNGVSQGVPQQLFPAQIRGGDNRPYAVDKLGQRFLLKVLPDPQLVVVMDWRTLLDR